MLTFAAILGREFDLAAVEQVSGVSLHELLETLDEAMTARVVIEAPGTRGRLRFAHTLIRDTIYEELTPRTADRPPPLGRRGARGVVRA